MREEDGRLNVRYPIGESVARTPIDSLPIGEWPMPPVINAQAGPLAESFKPAFRQALECASRESGRYVLQGVCLDVSQKDCHTLVATDGHQLFAANTFSFPVAQPVILPERRFLTWPGFAEDGPWQLAVELDQQSKPAWVKLQSDHWTFVTKVIEGTYPNWRQVVPSYEGGTRLRFSPAAVETILEALPRLPVWNDLLQPVVLQAAGGQFCLKSHPKDSEDWTNVPVDGVLVTGPGFELTLNRAFVAKALRFGFVECDVNSATEPVQFTAPGRKFIAMPVGLKQLAPPAPNPNNEPQVEAAPPGAPSAAEPNSAPTEERKPMTDKPEKKTDSPLREAVERIEHIKETLRSVLNDFNSVLAAIRQAEKEKKTTENEVEAVRATLRSLQKVEI